MELDATIVGIDTLDILRTKWATALANTVALEQMFKPHFKYLIKVTHHRNLYSG